MPLTLDGPLTPTQQDSMSEKYHESSAVLAKTVIAFWRRYGGDLAELRADADTIFVEAWAKYKGAVPWHTHLNTWIWFSLLDAARKQARRAAKHPIQGGDVVHALTARAQRDITDITEAVTGDAAEVLALVLAPPQPLAAAAERKGGEPRNIRSTLRAHLRGIGWSAARVAESFEEIRRALG